MKSFDETEKCFESRISVSSARVSDIVTKFRFRFRALNFVLISLSEVTFSTTSLPT